MLERYKLFRFNNKTWIDSCQYVAYSIVLIVLVTLIDLRILPIQAYLPSFMKTSVGLAKGILTTLAAALLTITTFTFSTILGVLTFYANAYSPRTIENFVKERITMKVLGIFIGGFFYSISALTFMRDTFEFDTVIAGFVAVIYSIVSIFYFIVFVQKVIYSIQPVNLISQLYNEGRAAIDEEIERREAARVHYRELPDWPRVEIRASSSGYLNVVNEDGLISALKGKGAYLSLKRRIGEYIPEYTVLASLQLDPKFFSWSKDLIEDENIEAPYNPLGVLDIPEDDIELRNKSDNEAPDEEKEKIEILAEKLGDCFFLQDNQVTAVDYRYAMSKLVELALRAVSPGINDPNTAIHCIRKLSILFGQLAKSDLALHCIAEDEGFQININAYSLDEDLRDMFQPILHYAGDDFMVMRALVEGLEGIRQAASEKNRQLVDDFEDYVIGAVREQVPEMEFKWLLQCRERAEKAK